MPKQTIEERMAAVESQVAQIQQRLAQNEAQTQPASWEGIFGSFADSKGFEEAAQIGREYQQAQRDEDHNSA